MAGIFVPGADLRKFGQGLDGPEATAKLPTGMQPARVGHEARAHGVHAFFGFAPAQEFLAAVVFDQIPTIGQSRCGWRVLAAEGGFDLLENPRGGHGGAPDHETGNGRLIPALQGDVGRTNIAVPDHGNLHGRGHGGDDLPIGLPGITLGPGAAVHGEALDPGVLEVACVVRRIDRLRVPAGADFRRDRQRRDGPNDGRGNGGQQGAVAQEGAAAVFANDFVDGTTEVDVDEVGLFPVNDGGGAAGQLLRFRAEELDTERAFLR
jgi:hypothetical protein